MVTVQNLYNNIIFTVSMPYTVQSEVCIHQNHLFFALLITRMYGPLSEERCISLLVVVSLLGMDPWNSKDHLLLVEPLEARKLPTVDHPHQPVSHSLGPVRVQGLHKRLGRVGEGWGVTGDRCEGGEG